MLLRTELFPLKDAEVLNPGIYKYDYLKTGCLWPHLDEVFRVWALIYYKRWPCETGNLDIDTQKGGSIKTQGENHPQAKGVWGHPEPGERQAAGPPALPSRGLWPSSLQNWEVRSFCCLSPRVVALCHSSPGNQYTRQKKKVDFNPQGKESHWRVDVGGSHSRSTV